MLILGNALEKIENFDDDYFDIGVTSPPYNKKKVRGGLVGEVKYDNSDDNLPENEYQKVQIDVLNALFNKMKPGGSFFYNHKMRWNKGIMINPFEWLSKTKWTLRQEIIWNRTLTGNLRGWRFWNIDERIYWLYKPIDNNYIGEELESKHSKMTSIWNIKPEKGVDHPAPFPVEIPTRCIYSILDGKSDKKVIDPYCGSGTTGIVCDFFGYDFVGIDVSEKYINYAKKRIENASNEFDKIKKEISLHVVKNPYSKRKKSSKKNSDTDLFFE